MSYVNKVQAVVYQENTLGLLGINGSRPSIEILSTKSKSFGSTPHSSIIHSVDANDYREATLADFDRFRVCHSDCYLIAQT